MNKKYKYYSPFAIWFFKEKDSNMCKGNIIINIFNKKYDFAYNYFNKSFSISEDYFDSMIYLYSMNSYQTLYNGLIDKQLEKDFENGVKKCT